MHLQVLESFKIMDYSLLLGIHVLDRKPLSRGSRCDSKKGQKVLYSTALESIQGNLKDPEPVTDDDTYVTVSHWTSKNHQLRYRPFAACHSSLLDSFHKRDFLKLEFYKSIFVVFCSSFLSSCHRLGGIPAKHRDENLLIFLGIIDILQSYR